MTQSYDGEQLHKTAVVLNVVEKDGQRTVVSIGEADCDCAARITKSCTHIASLLMAAFFLFRGTTTTTTTLKWLGACARLLLQARKAGKPVVAHLISIKHVKMEDVKKKIPLEGRETAAKAEQAVQRPRLKVPLQMTQETFERVKAKLTSGKFKALRMSFVANLPKKMTGGWKGRRGVGEIERGGVAWERGESETYGNFLVVFVLLSFCIFVAHLPIMFIESKDQK